MRFEFKYHFQPVFLKRKFYSIVLPTRTKINRYFDQMSNHPVREAVLQHLVFIMITLSPACSPISVKTSLLPLVKKRNNKVQLYLPKSDKNKSWHVFAFPQTVNGVWTDTPNSVVGSGHQSSKICYNEHDLFVIARPTLNRNNVQQAG